MKLGPGLVKDIAIEQRTVQQDQQRLVIKKMWMGLEYVIIQQNVTQESGCQ